MCVIKVSAYYSNEYHRKLLLLLINTKIGAICVLSFNFSPLDYYCICLQGYNQVFATILKRYQEQEFLTFWLKFNLWTSAFVSLFFCFFFNIFFQFDGCVLYFVSPEASPQQVKWQFSQLAIKTIGTFLRFCCR